MSEHIADAPREFGRFNSYVRRTTTRYATTANGEHFLERKRDADFIDILTQVSLLYQQHALRMETLDDWKTEPLGGAGSTFEVSTRTSASTEQNNGQQTQIKDFPAKVVIKRTPVLVHDANGKPFKNLESRHAANAIHRELKVLSVDTIRGHQNVVKLLGVAWSYLPCPDACPRLALVLEQAETTLEEYIHRETYIPIDRRLSLCQNIANGLLAIHECGVIHGDIKPTNVLIFNNPNEGVVAKIADFSHSLFDTGESRHLVGGTWEFSAPECKHESITSLLMKTDIYSLGIVVGFVILRKDVIISFLETQCKGSSESRMLQLQRAKEQGTFQEFILVNLYKMNVTDIEFENEHLLMIETWLDKTLALDPALREITAITESHTSERKLGMNKPRLSSDEELVDIPYQSFEHLSNILKRHVVMSLLSLAGVDSKGQGDIRAAAASFELCVCYASGFGVPYNKEEASKWLFRAARMGESTAQSLCHRLFLVFDQNTSTSTDEFDHWLLQSASIGSWTALTSLKERCSANYTTALENFRRTTSPYERATLKDLNAFSEERHRFTSVQHHEHVGLHRTVFGQTFIHMATLESIDYFKSLSPISTDVLDIQDHNGDTALIYACRAGRADIAMQLLKAGANARSTNHAGENALHFLHTVENIDLEPLARFLVRRGADCTQESKETEATSSIFDARMSVPGTPILRAVTMSNIPLARILITLKLELQPPDTLRRQMIWHSVCFKLLAWSCRINDGEMVDHICELFTEMGTVELKTLTCSMREQNLSLPALAIIGCVADDPSYGFDLPGQFWRFVHHGKGHRRQLCQTFRALKKFGIDTVYTSCGESRNTLFYAIRKGHYDAVSILLEDSSESKPLEPFGTPFNKDIFPQHDSITSWPDHQLKSGLIRAILFTISTGKHEIFQLLLKTFNNDAFEMGEHFDVLSTPERAKAPWTINISRLFPPFDTRSSSSPFRHIYMVDKRRLPPLLKRYSIYFSDGRLNYSLLYMIGVALSEHRDLDFADTLLKHGSCELSIANHWGYRNVLEQHCFGGHFPLVTAAQRQWKALVTLLIRHAADVDAKCFLVWPKLRKKWIGVHSNGLKHLLGQSTIRIRRILGYYSPSGIYTTNIFKFLLVHEDPPDNTMLLAMLLQLGPRRAFMPFSSAVEELSFLYKCLNENRKPHDPAFLSLERSIWKDLTQRYKLREAPRNADCAVGFVYRAAMDGRYTALLSFLDMGFSPHGKWWNRFWFTPFDAVSVLPKKTPNSASIARYSSQDAERSRCFHILISQKSVRGGVGFYAETQILISLLMWISLYIISYLGVASLFGLFLLVITLISCLFVSRQDTFATMKDKWDLFYLCTVQVFPMAMIPGIPLIAFMVFLSPFRSNLHQKAGRRRYILSFPFLSLQLMAAEFHWSIFDCARALRGPSAIFFRAILWLLNQDTSPMALCQQDTIQLLENENGIEELVLEPRWQRQQRYFDWISRLLPGSRRRRRLLVARDAYTDDPGNEQLVQLLPR